MPFDPSLPPDEGRVLSTMLRAQFNALNDRMDANPGITSVVVDSVTTVAPTQPAGVTVSVIGTVLHVSLTIPQGNDGAPGGPGPQGPPFANVLIENVTTLAPGQPATVSVSFDGTHVRLSFGIPQGAQGEQGIQGPMGEVTNAALASAISSAITGTANNTNGVATLDTPFTNDPLSLADGELIRAKINELILAQRR